MTRRAQASTVLRAAAILAAATLSACVAPQPGARQAAQLNAPTDTAPSAGRRVAILLPLTGPNAALGQALLQSAQLSLARPGSPELLQQDTAGTPEGAAAAARAAIAAGAGIILGPLTSAETAAAAPLARAANVPVLAFTSDSTQGQPGVWPLGISPTQQVRRLVLAVAAENKTRLAAVVPQNIFGDALANGALASAAAAQLPPPKIVRTANTFPAMNDALKDISDYANRRGAIEAAQRTPRPRPDPANPADPAAAPGREPGLPPPPPPMDALLLGVTGNLLGQVVPLLAFYDIAPTQLRILGPGTWAREAAQQPALAGAWFAAPDPASRAGFEREFTARYNAPPRDLASIAYDAAGIARAAATPEGFSPTLILRPEGFAGADGLIGFLPDGQVRRGLAIFEVDRAGSHIVQPPPQSLSAPGV